MALATNITLNKTRAALNRESKAIAQLQLTHQQISEQLQKVNATIDGLGNMALAYEETPEGLKLVPAEIGASKNDLDFLQRFRGPILDLHTDFTKLSSGQIQEALKKQLVSEFESDPRNLTLAKTKRRALITFAILRVNGSMPTYEVRDNVPNAIRSMILGTSGNCSDFTIRMMMVAEALGLKAALISANTPALQGHVFVDAYDPEEDTAYILDANFNVKIVRRGTGGLGFFESLLKESAEQRREYAEKARIRAMPIYFRYVDPGEKALFGTPLTASFINAIRSKREPMWRHWTADDVDDLLMWWQKTPTHRPRTLAEIRGYLTEIPAEFNASGDYAARIRAAAGVDTDTLAANVNAQAK